MGDNINMSDFVTRIDLCLKNMNLKRAALCEACGIANTSITIWKNRNTIPAADVAIKIADYLDVPLRWLLTGQNDFELSKKKTMIDDFRKLDDNQQMAVLGLIASYNYGNMARGKLEAIQKESKSI